MSRADKCLRKVLKDIQNLYIYKKDDIVLLQQVTVIIWFHMMITAIMILSWNASQREVELRELQEQNALVLQDIAEFTIRHVEAEAYVKKLLMAKNIELPSFSPSIRSPISSCDSSMSSAEQPLKSTSRVSVFTSSRESIGNIIKIEPQFEECVYQITVFLNIARFLSCLGCSNGKIFSCINPGLFFFLFK